MKATLNMAFEQMRSTAQILIMVTEHGRLTRPLARTESASFPEAEHIFTIRPDQAVREVLESVQGVVAGIDNPPSASVITGLTGLESVTFDRAKFWPAWEALSKNPCANETEAVSQVEKVLGQAGVPEVNAELIRALRLSEPAQFKFDAVRAKTLNALAPYAADVKVLSVFIQELELHLKNKHSVQVAVDVINSQKLITNPELSERILAVILAQPGDEIERRLIPRLSPISNSASVAKACQDAVAIYKDDLDKSYSALKVLALSGDRSAENLLCKIACQDIDGPWQFKNFGGVIGTVVALGIIGTFAGWAWAADSNASSERIVSSLFMGMRIGGGFGAFISIVGGGIPRVYRAHFTNINVAKNAVELLGLCRSSHRAEATLLRLLLDSKQGLGLRQMAAESITNFQSDSTTDKLCQGVKDGGVDLKLLCLTGLSKTKTQAAITAVQIATEDPAPTVMTQAYKTLDAIKPRG